MNIIITENQILKIREALNDAKIIYSAIFVDKDELIRKYEPYHENKYYDHSTIELNPIDISDLPIGQKVDMKIIGRLTNDYVDVILVENKLSKNKYPHITLSTAQNIKPSQSNTEIEKNIDRVVPLNDNIIGTVGVFTNHGIITTKDGDINEDINIPISTGDTILMGKFKNKKTIVKDIDKDEYNMPTINGKKAVTFRIPEKEDIINEVIESEVDLSSFEAKKELNNKFWGPNDKLNKKVRVRLLKIADDFLESINVDSKYCQDVLFVGSMANYFWSKYSDIDLHLIVDFKKINDDVELVKDYFDSKKQLWNDEHDNLKIYGFPVEIYIQDINEKNASTSIYSIEKNKWIKKPDANIEEPLDVDKIKKKSAEIMTKIDELNTKFNSIKDASDTERISTDVKKLFDKIKLIRKSGLDSKKGELSPGNIIFKVLRRTDYISKLIDLKRSTYDKLNTIK